MVSMSGMGEEDKCGEQPPSMSTAKRRACMRLYVARAYQGNYEYNKDIVQATPKYCILHGSRMGER